MTLLRSILTPIMLRRTKSTVDSAGNPIITLPAVDIKVLWVFWINGLEPSARFLNLED